MRKIVLIAAMALISASAQAAGLRGLTLASADDSTAQQVTTPTPQATDATKPVEAPKDAERPTTISTSTPARTATTPSAPAAPATKPVHETAAKADKPKPKRYWTERRVIGELHRYGIYW